MTNNKLPKISIVIVTYNNERTIEECVLRIKSQDYPKDKIEYLNVDGGSVDNTKRILKKYSFRIISSPIPHNAEAQRGIGVKEAKNNLIASIDADNYLPSPLWLKQMVKPFIDDKEVIHAGTMHFGYNRKDKLFNRYFALFGVIDPIVYYIGKPDRLPWFSDKWIDGEILKETPGYYIVRFTYNSLPTVGCNGVVYRRDLLINYTQNDPSKFLHIDVFVELLNKGYNKYAIVKNDIIHDTAISLATLMKKRINFLLTYYLQSKKNRVHRRYFIYNPNKPKDIFKLFLFILYTVTFVKPLFDSIRGYVAIRDQAWFLHPIICWVYLSAYSLATIKKFFTNEEYKS